MAGLQVLYAKIYNMTDLRGQLALVTGASGGIGFATCVKLASEGVDIAVHFHKAKDKAEDLVKQLRQLEVKAESFQADLSDYAEVTCPRQHSKYYWWF